MALITQSDWSATDLLGRIKRMQHVDSLATKRAAALILHGVIGIPTKLNLAAKCFGRIQEKPGQHTDRYRNRVDRSPAAH